MSAITFRHGAFAGRALATPAILVAALLAGRLTLADAELAVSRSDPAVGQSAPALVAHQFDGQSIDLATLRGQVVVLNFWASWCTPCRAEMPALDALAREFRERGVTVIGLSVDDRHDRRDALKAAEGLSYSLGMVSDATVNGFGAVREIPLTYIIGRDRAIKAIIRANQGAASAEQLHAAVEQELAPALEYSGLY